MSNTNSTDLIRGHTDTIILNVLRQGDSYGYEIYKTIIELSGNQYELKEATLYTAFRRLDKDGYIQTYWGDDMRQLGKDRAKQSVYSSTTARVSTAGLIVGVLLILFGTLVISMLFFMDLPLVGLFRNTGFINDDDCFLIHRQSWLLMMKDC